MLLSILYRGEMTDTGYVLNKWYFLLFFFPNNQLSCNIIRYKRLKKQGTCMLNINNFGFFSHPIVYLVQSNPVCTRWHQLWILSHFVSDNYILTCFTTFLHIKSHRSWKFLARKNLNTKQDPNFYLVILREKSVREVSFTLTIV